MTDPIISPWIIYLISILEPLSELSLLISIILCLAFTGFTIARTVIILDEGKENDASKTFRLIRKKILPYLLIFLTLSIFLPSKETAIAILIANEITYEKVQKTGEIEKEVYKQLKQDIFRILEIEEPKQENSNEKTEGN